MGASDSLVLSTAVKSDPFGNAGLLAVNTEKSKDGGMSFVPLVDIINTCTLIEAARVLGTDIAFTPLGTATIYEFSYGDIHALLL